MALLTFNPLSCFFSSPISSSFSSTSFPLVVSPICRLRLKAIEVPPAKCCIFSNNKRLAMSLRPCAVSVDGEAEDESAPKEALAVEQLPLESEAKKRQLMEQRMRMKEAKKIRLRQKRLLRKRNMRKKGRWPPSKMKKLKNV